MINETALKIKEIEKRHLEQINNPKINKDDNFYSERLVLLVHEKSNWHLYYDPKYNTVYSIAVVEGAKSSCFGSVEYFKRWYDWTKNNQRKTVLCLSDKAVQLLGF